jgi:hypothetical protein
MRGLFWLSTGIALGAFGYRYYAQNGGRLPIVEQILGGRTDQLARQAAGMAQQVGDTAKQARQSAQEAATETAAKAAKQTVAAVAEEIADAEDAKRREELRASSLTE